MLTSLLAPALALLQEPLQLGTRREPFVDRHLIERLEGAELRLGSPRDEGIVLTFDRPWEGPFCGYSTVLRDGDRLLLYYRGLPTAGADGTDREVTCVATSADGVRWERPELELFPGPSGEPTNIVLARQAPASHNFSPFLDTRPGVPADERFKALAGTEATGLLAFASADGLSWRRLGDEAVFRDGIFDSQNVAFWSDAEERYLCYFRTWTGQGYSGFRTVSRTTSEDFRQWSKPEVMTFGGTPQEHLYTNQTHPYFRAPHVYIGLAARFFPGKRVLTDADAARLGVDPGYFRDCSDAVLLTSRGGSAYDRTFMEGLLRPGIGLENWVSRSNYPALGIVRTGATEMSLYVNQSYAQPTAHLRRYSLRLDGLAAVVAGYEGGELLTRPFTFEGDELTLNLATSAAGQLRVEVQDEAGEALEGLALADAVPLVGNDLERRVTWSSGADLGSLAGTTVRLRIQLQDAHLYSLRFRRRAEAPQEDRPGDR